MQRRGVVEIRRGLTIQGWMSPEEMHWLAEQAAEHELIVEIGSYMGRSTRALADSTAGKVYAVDNFKGPSDVVMTDKERDALYGIFTQNLSDLIKNQKVVPVKTDHAVLSDVLEELKPDMVFIDGSHEYVDVVRDIKYWLPKISKEGLICGHDIQHPPVRQAVTELVKDFKTAASTSIWYAQVA